LPEAGRGDRTANATTAGRGNRTANATTAGSGDRTANATTAGRGDRTENATTAGRGDRTENATTAGRGNRMAAAVPLIGNLGRRDETVRRTLVSPDRYVCLRDASRVDLRVAHYAALAGVAVPDVGPSLELSDWLAPILDQLPGTNHERVAIAAGTTWD